MTFPLIHNNGTGIKALTAEYNDAHDAFEAFKMAFCATTHHARDYYPLGQDAFAKASKERQGIFRHMESIQTHIDAMRLHLYES